jgi:hypothetical protein
VLQTLKGQGLGLRWFGFEAEPGLGEEPVDEGGPVLDVIYGLRVREVAAPALDDIDWKRDRLAIPARKAGHSAAFPLSAVVGGALVNYLRHGRPPVSDRHE